MVQPECLNCHIEVAPESGRLFAGVLVCSTCFALAERVYDRGRHELGRLQTVLQESIRLALVEGRLQLQEGRLDDVSKRDVFQAIVQLLERRRVDPL